MPPFSSLLEYVERTPKLYRFCYFKAILSPNKINLKYYIWIGCLRVSLPEAHGIFILSVNVSQLKALITDFVYFFLSYNYILYIPGEKSKLPERLMKLCMSKPFNMRDGSVSYLYFFPAHIYYS